MEEVLFNFYNYNSKKKGSIQLVRRNPSLLFSVFFKDVIFSVAAIHLTWMQAHFQRL